MIVTLHLYILFMLDWTTLSLSNSENNELLKHVQNVTVLTFIHMEANNKPN